VQAKKNKIKGIGTSRSKKSRESNMLFQAAPWE
jgi:hypothetical protein